MQSAIVKSGDNKTAFGAIIIETPQERRLVNRVQSMQLPLLMAGVWYLPASAREMVAWRHKRDN